MTNEEILKKYSVGGDNPGPGGDSVIVIDALKAMDAAREDEAVGFAEWITIRGYEQRVDSKWTKYYKISESGDFTTAQLYQLYLKHKNEKL